MDFMFEWQKRYILLPNLKSYIMRKFHYEMKKERTLLPCYLYDRNWEEKQLVKVFVKSKQKQPACYLTLRSIWVLKSAR